jgi:hypothetical protein
MVSEIRIYVEGGGDRADSKSRIREGFGLFLKDLRELARSKSIRWQIIACGGRESTFEDFQTALLSHPDAFNILLVDSEAPVRNSPWQHLQQRDRWKQPEGTTDEQCHLMAQTMEAWLIADVDALSKFYGQGFTVKAIPRRQNVEEIDKANVTSALENATRPTKTGKYHKIRHGPKLLQLVNVQIVRVAAPHCNRLFETLQHIMDDT